MSLLGIGYPPEEYTFSCVCTMHNRAEGRIMVVVGSVLARIWIFFQNRSY